VFSNICHCTLHTSAHKLPLLTCLSTLKPLSLSSRFSCHALRHYGCFMVSTTAIEVITTSVSTAVACRSYPSSSIVKIFYLYTSSSWSINSALSGSRVISRLELGRSLLERQTRRGSLREVPMSKEHESTSEQWSLKRLLWSSRYL
jgi:hypothetical protein